MTDVVDFGAARAELGSMSTERLSFICERFAVGDNPEVRIIGNNCADLEAACRLLASSLLTIGNQLVVNERDPRIPLLVSTCWSDGTVTNTFDVVRMDNQARREWLIRTVALIREGVDKLLADNPLSEIDDATIR